MRQVACANEENWGLGVGGRARRHEILPTVRGICNSGSRALVGRVASRVVGVDQGEVAPLFSV